MKQTVTQLNKSASFHSAARRKAVGEELVGFSHDRVAPFQETCDALFGLIEDVADGPSLKAVYGHFEKAYRLPVGVVKQKIKRHLAVAYIPQQGCFGAMLRLRRTIVGMLIHVGFLGYALVFSRSTRTEKRYELIVDGIASPHELARFANLIRLFGTRRVLVATSNPTVSEVFPDYEVHCAPRFRGYDRRAVVKAFKVEVLRGLWISVWMSLKLRMNLFYALTPVVKDYLQYYSLFRSNRAPFLIQERHYNTSAVKNFLFKRFGGKAATSIQKNILMNDQSSFYYDMDCFFSLGRSTVARAFQYGGRIDQVVPVGSMFMEHYWYGDVKAHPRTFDVVMLGINTMNAMSRLDAYNGFVDDYYETIRWLVRFKQEFPAVRIAIKHHASAGEDRVEEEIIQGSGIEQLEKAGNSYEAAFRSCCTVTYGSTMGYELNAHGVPVLFLDPGGRCTILPNAEEALLGPLHVTDFDSMRRRLRKLLQGDGDLSAWLRDPESLCMHSSGVSKRIHHYMKAAVGKNTMDRPVEVDKS